MEGILVTALSCGLHADSARFAISCASHGASSSPSLSLARVRPVQAEGVHTVQWKILLSGAVPRTTPHRRFTPSRPRASTVQWKIWVLGTVPRTTSDPAPIA